MKNHYLVFCLSLLLIFNTYPGHLSAQDSFQTLFDSYYRYANLKQYDSAYVYALRTKEKAVKEFGEISWQNSRANNGIGNSLIGLNKFDASTLFYLKESLRIADLLTPAIDSVTYKPLINLSVFFAHAKQLDSVAYYAKLRLHLTAKTHGAKSAEYCLELNSIAADLMNQNIFDSSVEDYLRQSLQIAQSLNPPKDSITFFPISNLNTFFINTKQFDSASRYTSLRLSLTASIYGAYSKEYLNGLCQIGYRYWKTEQYDSARKYYNLSLPIRGKLVGLKSEEVVRDITYIIDTITNGKYNSYNIFSLPGQVFTWHQLDSLSTQIDDITQKRVWKQVDRESFYWYLQKKDAALIEFGEKDSTFAFSLQELGYAFGVLLQPQMYHLSKYIPVSEYCINEAVRILKMNEGPESVNVADAYGTLAVVYHKGSYYSKSLDMRRKALPIYEKKLGKYSDKYEQALLDATYEEQWNYEKADFDSLISKYRLTRQISDSVFGKESLRSNRVKEALASLYEMHGRLQQALQLKLEVAKKITDSLGRNSQRYLDFAKSVQTTYYYLQDLKNAEIWQEIAQGADIDIKVPANDNKAYSKIWNGIDNVQIKIPLGQYEESQKILDTILPIIVKYYGKKSDPYTSYCNLQSELNINTGKFENTDTLLLISINHEEVGTNSDSDPFADEELARSYATLGLVYLKTNKIGQSGNALFKSLSLFHKHNLDTTGAVGDCYGYLGDYYLLANRPDSAIYCYRKALEGISSTHTDKFPLYQDAAEKLAVAFWHTHQYDKAESILRTACANINSDMLSNFTGLSETEKLKYSKVRLPYVYEYYSLHQLINTAIPGSNASAYQFALDAKGLILNSTNEVKSIIGGSGDTILQNLYAQLVQARADLYRSYSLSKEQQLQQGLSSDSLESVANRLEKEIGLRSDKFALYSKQKNAGFDDIRAALADDEAAIEFVSFPFFNGKSWSDSVFYAEYIIRKDAGAPIYLFLATENELVAYTGDHGLSGRGLKLQRQTGNDASRKLYDLLWGPVEKYLHGTKTVYIATDGLVNSLPFAALRGPDGKFLSDSGRYELRFLLSTRDVVKLKSRAKAIKEKSIALFGGADYNAGIESNKGGQPSLPVELAGTQPWPPLAGTLTEVDSIASTLKSTGQWEVQLERGAQATEDKFNSLATHKSPAIIHIATHGFYFPQEKEKIGQRKYGEQYLFRESDNPLIRSGILLSGANRTWLAKDQKDGRNDGIVTAYQIANMNLSNTDLVVLSACETAKGEIRSGEGVFGLQRALRQAGVHKMIVSFWSVSDNETSELMQLFYKEIALGLDFKSAFQSAQSEMRNKYRDHPGLWAGFELIE